MRMRRTGSDFSRSAATWLLVAAIGAVVLVARPSHGAGLCNIGIADYTCTTLTYPAASSTEAKGLNNAGQAVGFYELQGTHAFSYSGSFNSLPDPSGASAIWAFDVNDAGVVVGNTLSSGGSRGFVRSGGTYTALTYPGAGNTYAFGIDALGRIVGAYDDGTANAAGHGFLLSGGIFTSISVPGSTSTYVYGVNDSGVLAGTYVDASGRVSGFTLNNGSFASINVPGAQMTFVRGLNGLGDLVGEYVDSLSKTRGFVRLGSGDFWTFDIVGTTKTFAAAINDSRTIAGSFLVGPDTYQSFIATPLPVPLPAALPLFAAGLLAVTRFRRTPTTPAA